MRRSSPFSLPDVTLTNAMNCRNASRVALLIALFAALQAGTSHAITFTSRYSNATVFRDGNGNASLDVREMRSATRTDAQGSFTPPRGKGRLFLQGGTDLASGQPNTLLLSAPSGARGISVLTSLFQALSEKKPKRPATARSVLNLNPKTKVQDFNFVPLSRATGAAQEVVRRDAQQNVLARFLKSLSLGAGAGAAQGAGPQRAAAAPKPPSGPCQKFKGDAAICALAEALRNGNLQNFDLSRDDTVTSILSDALTTANVSLSDDDLAQVVDAATDINVKFDDDGDIDTDDEFEKLFQIAFNAAVVMGADDFGTLDAQFTDDGLDNQIDGDLFVPTQPPNTTELLSVTTDGALGDAGSDSPKVSADGRYAVFSSAASNLIDGDDNDQRDVFRRDTFTRESILVSAGLRGLPANGPSAAPSVNADGRFVAFASDASNLVGRDTNDTRDVFVRDVQARTTKLVSIGRNGAPANGGSSEPSIDEEGRRIAFTSTATNLVNGIGEARKRVYLRNLANNTTALVSLGSSGQLPDDDSDAPALSANGQWVAFVSSATNLTDDNNSDRIPQILIREIGAKTPMTQLISQGAEGPGNGASATPAISADGRFVAYATSASNLVDRDTDDTPDVLVFDRCPDEDFDEPCPADSAGEGQTALVSDDSIIRAPRLGNQQPSISGNGRFVSFHTQNPLSNLDVNGNLDDIYIRDVRDANTVLATRGIDGASNGTSVAAHIAGNSPVVVFQSNADNLVAGTQTSGDAIPVEQVYAVLVDRLAAEGFAPSLDTNAGIALQEGGSAIVDVSLLSATDADTAPEDISFIVASPPNHGRLEAVSQPGVALEIFSQADLEAGEIRYVHDGSETTSDGFFILLVDDAGLGPTEPLAVSIAVTPVNDNPSFSAPLFTVDETDRLINLTVLDPDQPQGTPPVLALLGGLDAALFDINASGRLVLRSLANFEAPNDSDRDNQYQVQIQVTDAQGGSAVTDLAIRVNDRADFQFERATLQFDLSGNFGSGSYGPSVSADGRFTVFATDDGTLLANDDNFTRDIVLHDAQSGTFTRVSNGPNGNAANSFSDSPMLSADGRFVVFQSSATDLVAGDTDFDPDVFRYEIATGAIDLISKNASGTSANSSSFFPAISATGRFVAYLSHATDIDPNDPDPSLDAYLHDTVTGVSRVVSIRPNGLGAGGASDRPSVSADGRFVVFGSSGDNLISGDTNGNNDVFVFDGATATVRLVSRIPNGAVGDGFSHGGQISADGRYIAFATFARNLIPNDTNNTGDVVRYDLATDQLQLVSRKPDGTVSNSISSSPRISGDGRFVVYHSFSSDLVSPSLQFGRQNVYRFDAANNTTVLVSQSRDGQPSNGDGSSFSNPPGISDDGSVVAFESTAADLVVTDTNQAPDIFRKNLAANPSLTIALSNVRNAVMPAPDRQERLVAIDQAGANVAFQSEQSNLDTNDDNGSTDVFVRNVASRTTRRATNGTLGGAASGTSTTPSLSDDGLTVAFASTASDLIADDSNGFGDIFLVNLQSRSVQRVTRDAAGTGEANGSSRHPALSGDAAFVAFESDASNLIPADLNSLSDVFVVRLADGQVLRASEQGGLDGNGPSGHPSISRDGQVVVFDSLADNLLAEDSNAFFDVYLRGANGSLRLVSRTAAGIAGDGDSRAPSVSANGQLTVFESGATNLVTGDTNGVFDVFLFNSADNSVTLLSKARDNNPANGRSWAPAISSDGKFAYFQSDASDLVVHDTNQDTDVFRVDLQTGTTVIVSDPFGSADGASFAAASNGSGGLVAFQSNASQLFGSGLDDFNGVTDTFLFDFANTQFEALSTSPAGQLARGATFGPVLSGDGNSVAFAGSRDYGFSSDGNGVSDIYVYDRVTLTPQPISSLFAPSNDASAAPSLNQDGTLVAFQSFANTLVPGDVNGSSDIFVHNRSQNEVVRISEIDGSGGNGNSITPTISADGRFVAFASDASNFVSDANNTRDIFVYDASLGTISRISESAGADADGPSRQPRISSDGSRIAFESAAGNLVAGQPGGTFRIFVQTNPPTQPAVVSLGVGSAPANGASHNPSLSSDGRLIAFESVANNLVLNDTNGVADVFVADLQAGTTELVSRKLVGGGAANAASRRPAISQNGLFVAFESDADDLVFGDINGHTDVFLYDRATGIVQALVSDPGFDGSDGPSFAPSISADGSVIVFESNASNLLFVDHSERWNVFVARPLPSP